MADISRQLALLPDSALRLSNLCGKLNEHIQQIETGLEVTIRQRGNVFQISGSDSAVSSADSLLQALYQSTTEGQILSPNQIHLALQEFQQESIAVNDTAEPEGLIKTPKGSIKPRSHQQRQYVAGIRSKDINFGVGPAGTGKTYLAVACAVEALVREQVRRLLLVRPAVEAGEKLGFLPGDLTQKIDPYLRPLYDALYEMLGFERVGRLIEKNIIEVAPLAYMRGRTLNNAFIILDESQNTTAAQMKMFLTRIGFGSTAVITGDITQVDLPKGSRSGLVHVSKVLQNIKDIGFTYFTAKDVVRHRLVQQIVEAYEEYDQQSVATLKSQEIEQRTRNESDG
ncbi:MAG: PhoH family protein [Gammaproteobacteria bacterium]|nr:PhoH family protein [Gammaproteobacteria bacterium]